jgi:hypothetical protein
MRYALLVRVTPGADPTPEEADPTAWLEEVKRRGMLIEAARLEDPPVATTVRVRDGKTLVTDGPFAEFKEYVAGICLLEADDVDEVMELAEWMPSSSFGATEIREVWPF